MPPCVRRCASSRSGSGRIALRFYHGLTQQRAAGILHISQVQVSRLERRAVERLREWLAT